MTKNERHSKNLEDAAKAELRRKFIAVNIHTRKEGLISMNKVSTLRRVERSQSDKGYLQKSYI